jgi:hypothetical protein
MLQEDIARLGEDITREGTPSPRLNGRIICTPQPQQPALDMESGVPQAKKRPAGNGLEGTSRKQVKVSSARSPWLFGRVADKASLSG